MGRRHPDSKVRHGRKSEKSKKSKRKGSGRHDDSDHSSLFSDPEEFSGDEHDSLGGRKSKKSFKEVDWTSDDDHSDLDSYGDNSYNHSDSDESDSFRFKKDAHGRSGKGSKNRKGYSSRNSDDKNSDNRSHFSARIKHIRREHEDSSFNSDDDSESDSHSSGSYKDSQKSRRPGSNSNLLEQSQRSLRSLQQSTRSIGQNPALNSSFRGQHQMQMSIPPRNAPPLMRSTSSRSLAGQERMQTSAPPRNTPPLMRSTSSRSLVGATGQTFFPGQQYQASGVLLNQSFVNKGQGQGQRIPETPGRNVVEGSISQRFPVGPGNMMRSMSGRSINSYSSGQVLQNRPSQSINVHSPVQVSPVTMMENSQISQCNNSGAYNGSLGNVLPSPSVYVQQPGVVHKGVPHTSSMNYQRPGLMTGASEGTLGINDGLPDTRMLSEKPGMTRLSSQIGMVNNNPLINNKSLNSQRPESMRGNLGYSNGLNAPSKQSNPIVRMDGTRQPMDQTKSSRNRSNSSVTGEAVLVMPGASENISILSSRRSSVLSSRRSSVLSSKSRRSTPPETLADQIYSRSRGRSRGRGRHEDTQSQGTFDDPPGEDSNRWERKIRDEIYSDDSSYDSFRDSRTDYVDDPPDMFDGDRSYKSGDDPERDEFDESFRSTDDRQSFYDEEDSNVSGLNEDDIGSISERSRSAFRDKKNKKRTGKSTSRLSSEFDHGKQGDRAVKSTTYKPERVSHSNNRDFHEKDQGGNITAATKQSSMSWLAQQISIRKSTDANAGTRNLEPEGVSNIGRKDFSSKDIKAPDADGICNDGRDESIRGHESDSDENSSLSSEADYIMKHKMKDAVLHSVKVGILRSDDSTTTTDTMTREVPSVILSVKDDEQDSFSDSDSLMSIPYDESTRGARTECKDEGKRSDPLYRSGRGKSTPQASNKKSHTNTSRRTAKRPKETRSRKNLGNDDVSSKVKKRSDRDTFDGKGSKNPSVKSKSLRKKESRSTDSVPRQIREPRISSTKRYSLKSNMAENSSQSKSLRRGNTERSSRTSGTRKSKKDRNNSSNLEHLEVHSFEDRHSVMGLIDQLKSFEFQV